MLLDNYKKIKPSSIGVYVGLDFVGDGLIKLPFIRSLRQVFPNSKITWIAGTHKSEFNRTLAPLVKGLLDEVVEEANIGFIGVNEAKISERLSDLMNFFKPPLNSREFDLLIDTQTHFFTSLIVMQPRLPFGANGDTSKIFQPITSSLNEVTWGGNLRVSPFASLTISATSTFKDLPISLTKKSLSIQGRTPPRSSTRRK